MLKYFVLQFLETTTFTDFHYKGSIEEAMHCKLCHWSRSCYQVNVHVHAYQRVQKLILVGESYGQEYTLARVCNTVYVQVRILL